MLDEDDSGSLIGRKPLHDEAKFDITAMIDLVFMMNIYFLVTMVTAAMEEINLPVARHCVPADRDTAVIISTLEDPYGGAGLVFVGEDHSGNPLTDKVDQERAIKAAVADGIKSQKSMVLIRAERHVHLRDIARVGGFAAAPELDLRLAVIEKE